MKLEDLNKSQLVLLTLLVSFVSSVATGIITTSLLNEAPVSVTQTINRVVERTVEKVVPDSSPREVSLREEDRLLLAAVEGASRNVVEIHFTPTGSTTTSSFLGVIVTSDGLVVTSLENLKGEGAYSAVLHDKSKLPLMLSATSSPDNVAIFKLGVLDEGNTAE